VGEYKFRDEIAERALLAILLNEPASFLDVMDFIGPGDFSTKTHEITFKALVSLLDESSDNLDGVDALTVLTKAENLGFKDIRTLTNDGEYIKSLFDYKVSKRNLSELVRKVKDLSNKRKLATAVNGVTGLLYAEDKTSVEIMCEMEKLVQEAINESTTGTSEIQRLGDGFLDWANANADEPQQMMGISTDIPRYDQAIGGGLRRGSINLIAARPKCFKSGLGLNVAKNVSVDGNIPVLILDTELMKDYQMARLGACASGVPIDRLENGLWRSNRIIVEQVQNASTKIANAPLDHVYIGGWDIEEILSAMRYWLTKTVKRREDGEFNDCVIVFDYIKLMNPKAVKSMAEWQVLGFQMTALHDFVTRHNVPMLLFAQLNREGGIAAADRLIWFASSFSTLAHKEREEMQKDGPAAGNLKLTTHMTRYGPGMDEEDYLNLRVNFPLMQLREGKMRSELDPDGPDAQEVNADNVDDEEE
jgi:replicative DNA helicase